MLSGRHSSLGGRQARAKSVMEGRAGERDGEDDLVPEMGGFKIHSPLSTRPSAPASTAAGPRRLQRGRERVVAFGANFILLNIMKEDFMKPLEDERRE